MLESRAADLATAREVASRADEWSSLPSGYTHNEREREREREIRCNEIHAYTW